MFAGSKADESNITIGVLSGRRVKIKDIDNNKLIRQHVEEIKHSKIYSVVDDSTKNNYISAIKKIVNYLKLSDSDCSLLLIELGDTKTASLGIILDNLCSQVVNEPLVVDLLSLVINTEWKERSTQVLVAQALLQYDESEEIVKQLEPEDLHDLSILLGLPKEILTSNSSYIPIAHYMIEWASSVNSEELKDLNEKYRVSLDSVLKI